MYLWDGMAQTVSMQHVPGGGPALARSYISTFLQFQQEDGHICSVISPPHGPSNGSGCSTDASVPNVSRATVHSTYTHTDTQTYTHTHTYTHTQSWAVH
jgi:hypothetical protein